MIALKLLIALAFFAPAVYITQFSRRCWHLSASGVRRPLRRAWSGMDYIRYYMVAPVMAFLAYPLGLWAITVTINNALGGPAWVLWPFDAAVIAFFVLLVPAYYLRVPRFCV